MQEILPTYLAMGVSMDVFMDSTPEELKPYKLAYEIRQRSRDTEMYNMGIYVLSAVQTAVQNSLYGKKANAQYLKEPLLANVESQDKELSEEQKKKEREKLLMTLQLMQTNFEMNHDKK